MKLYKRENYLKRIRGFYDTTDLIKVITRVRHSGKSSLMHTIADELIEKGISSDNIIYLDLDKREYRPLEKIKDNYPKYVATTDYILQKRNGIKHINIIEFMKEDQLF